MADRPEDIAIAVGIMSSRARAAEAARNREWAAKSTVEKLTAWGKDVAAVTPGALARGTAYALTAPEGLAHLAKRGIDYGIEWALPADLEESYSTTVGSKADADRAYNPNETTADRLKGGKSLIPSPADLAGMVDAATRVEPETKVGQAAATTAELVPNILGGGGGLIERGLTQVVGPAAGSEAAARLTEEYPALEPVARAVGAVLGTAAPAVVSRAVSPFPASPRRQEIADTLQQEGIDITAGQRSGSGKLRYVESELGGSTAEDFVENQRRQLTRATLRRIGVNSDDASTNVINGAFDDIGNQFNQAAARNTLVPDRQLMTDLRDTVSWYFSRVNEPHRAPIVTNYAREISEAIADNNGQIPGDIYQSIRSRMAADARDSAGDQYVQRTLNDMRDDLDDVMERSIQANNPADVGAFQEARRMYRDILVIEKAAIGGEAGALGLITPAKLEQAVMNTHGRRNYARGRGDFAHLAEAAQIMRDLPQSGTAPRLRTAGVTGLLGAALANKGGGDAVNMLLAALGASFIPRVAGSAVLSRPGRGYLSNEIMTGHIRDVDPTRAAIAAYLAGQNQEPP